MQKTTIFNTDKATQFMLDHGYSRQEANKRITELASSCMQFPNQYFPLEKKGLNKIQLGIGSGVQELTPMVCMGNNRLKLHVYLGFSNPLRLEETVKAYNKLQAAKIKTKGILPIKVRTEKGLIFRLCTKGDLLDCLDRDNLSLKEKMVILIDVLTTLKHLHDKGFIHRDIKPENILINNKMKAHIGDLEFLMSKAQKAKGGVSCTPQYLAKELLISPSPDLYDPKIDLWAFGLVVLQTFLTQSALKTFQNDIFGTFIQDFNNKKILENKKNVENWTDTIIKSCNQLDNNTPVINDIREFLLNYVFVDQETRCTTDEFLDFMENVNRSQNNQEKHKEEKNLLEFSRKIQQKELADEIIEENDKEDLQSPLT